MANLPLWKCRDRARLFSTCLFLIVAALLIGAVPYRTEAQIPRNLACGICHVGFAASDVGNLIAKLAQPSRGASEDVVIRQPSPDIQVGCLGLRDLEEHDWYGFRCGCNSLGADDELSRFYIPVFPVAKIEFLGVHFRPKGGIEVNPTNCPSGRGITAVNPWKTNDYRGSLSIFRKLLSARGTGKSNQSPLNINKSVFSCAGGVLSRFSLGRQLFDSIIGMRVYTFCTLGELLGCDSISLSSAGLNVGSLNELISLASRRFVIADSRAPLDPSEEGYYSGQYQLNPSISAESAYMREASFDAAKTQAKKPILLLLGFIAILVPLLGSLAGSLSAAAVAGRESCCSCGSSDGF